MASALPAWLARLYPFEPKSFRTPPGARMSYVDEGPRGDEAVLMVHGNPTWSFHFRDLIRDLSPKVRCVAPDHVGMGLSEKPEHGDYHLEGRIRDLGALIRELGLKRVHLIVHDWGGAIGLGWAVRNPELVGGIVILNTAAFPSDRIPKRIALCRVPVLGALLVRGLNAFADAATWMATAARRLTYDERRGYLLPYGSWARRVAIHQFVRDIPLEAGHRSRGTLEAVAAGLPRLAKHRKTIAWGGRDFCFDETFLARWREIFPDAPVDLYAGWGHYVLEDGGAELRASLVRFIAGCRQSHLPNPTE